MAGSGLREEVISETFIIYADHSGSLPVESLGTCLRALGWNPSEVEVQVRCRERQGAKARGKRARAKEMGKEDGRRKKKESGEGREHREER